MKETMPPAGPKGNWLTGNVADFRRDRLGFFERCAREHGDVASFRLGPKRLFMLSHPDHIERVLVGENKQFEKHYVLRLLKSTLGNGLVLSEGDFWLRQRRLMQPAFQRSSIASYGESMVALTRRLTDGWQAGQSLDIHREMERLALWIAAKTLLSVEVGDDLRHLSGAIDVMMEDFNRQFVTPLRLPEWVPTPHNLKARRARGSLSDVVTRIIAERRAGSDGRGDLLSMLLAARHEDDGRGMDDRQLRDEVMTMFLAGHETTAAALAWTWMLLSQNPRAEERLQSELQAVLVGRDPTAADLPRLPYAEAIVKESMRLYPPAFVIGRQSTAPFEVDGHVLPAGATILMCQWIVQRDERWFEEPTAFRPERWENNLEKRLPKFAYFPFGGGPRVCIGNMFAMMETVLVLAAIAQRHRIRVQTDPAIVPWPAITLRPRGGMPAVVEAV